MKENTAYTNTLREELSLLINKDIWEIIDAYKARKLIFTLINTILLDVDFSAVIGDNEREQGNLTASLFLQAQKEYLGSGFKIDFNNEMLLNEAFHFLSLKTNMEDLDLSILKVISKEILIWSKRWSITETNVGKLSLPYALSTFQIHQFQCIKNIEVELPSDAQFIVFTGENGDGKTSILQGLSMGFYNSQALTGEERGVPNTLIQVKYKTEKGIIHNEICNNPNFPILYSLKDKIQELPAFAAYSAARLDAKDKIEIHNPLLNIFNTQRSQLLDIFTIWLKETSANEPEKFEAVVKVLLSLLPNISEIKKVHPERLVSDFVFVEKGVEVPLKHLSAGHKSIVLMIGDMIIRLANAQPKIQSPTDFKGIVMIDELEAHLHPKWQKAFPKLLSQTFPKVQFIVTTHSAITLLGMPKNTALFKVSRSEAAGTTVEKIDVELENLTPNLILTSPIFGLENIFNSNYKDIESVFTGNDFEDIENRSRAKDFVRELMSKRKVTNEKG